jgi:tRNA(Ile)-lysidine synthase
MGLHPAVAACRVAVRRVLAPLEGETVLVACSGGADSLALLAATVFEARRLEIRVVGVTVDHDLQVGSAEHAARVVLQMAQLGVDETASARVVVDPRGDGIEGAARRARYEVLEQMRQHFGARLVLLGHTRDDQAETVLMGLARGSGARSMAGMRRSYDHYARPLLDVTRADTVTACQVEGIEVWDDPHNDDPGFTRVRVRKNVLPVLEDQLGPGVAASLARTADQVRDDVEALDAIAAATFARLATSEGVPLRPLYDEYRAIASRVVRLAAIEAGAIDAELFHVHVTALIGLAEGTVRGEVQLPGHVTAYVRDRHLAFRRTGEPDGARTT